ncbi:MAG: hypothetical protein KC469_05465 [Flavobacteriaceae bacterium]|jgi:hypothetical protein|nr:hypothetical protein [Flavobacteriaceae bacterium]
MKLQKLLTIIALVVGVIAVFFLIRIISAGDEAIEGSEDLQNSLIAPFMYIAYIVLGLIVVFVLFFTLKNMFSNPATLKSTLTGVGAFALIGAICYFALASGEETALKDGEMLTAGESKLIGAGLYMFYALALIASGSMLFTGLKKMINK